jgi:GntR family histidine utilization transcriptional repressor
MAAIRADIASGRLKAGDRIPSEHELTAAFGVSRMTANRAVRELTQEGLVSRRTGSGSYVCARRMELSLLRVPDIAEEIRAGAASYSAIVTERRRIAADAAAASALEIAIGDAVLHTRIIHCADGRPLQLEDRIVNPAFAPDYLEQDFARLSPNAYLTAIGRPEEVEQTVEAVAAGAVEARLLDIPKGHVCLMITRRTWCAGLVATFVRLTSPGERWRMNLRFKT